MGTPSTPPLPISELKRNLFNLSVEEENLASFPFAVLEQRVGKQVGKLEVKGSKMLPDGTEVQVLWEVQGNTELGLPTEQDLDIFVALGVLTFRNHFSKTVTFQGREVARILNIASVHGKFYDRLKLAMDRFIALRFRALTQTERSEDVKWISVFQEASFAFDRDSGRCVGSVTWTDRIIQAIDNGFFRLFDAKRYMELDGLTTKYMYRFLAVAYESTDVVLIDIRKLATQHLGIVQPPKYFSRLMQTIEPALEQLRRREVVESWHVISKSDWRIAIRCHGSYVPERKRLLTGGGMRDPEARRQQCQDLLEQGGLPKEFAATVCLSTPPDHKNFDALERSMHLLARMAEEQVLPHVAQQLIRKALEGGMESEQWQDSLDWIEIGLSICDQKRRSRQPMRNGAGLIVKLAKDAEARQQLVGQESVRTWQNAFRRREGALLRQHQEVEERHLLLEYEQYREAETQRWFGAVSDETRQQWKQQKRGQLRAQERFAKLSDVQQGLEIEAAILADIVRQQVPSFEKWRMRRLARQAMLPFFSMGSSLAAGEEAPV